jgi:hypothetical protein
MKPLQTENCFQHTFIWVIGAFYFRQQQVMTILLLYQCIKEITECAVVMNTEFKQNKCSCIITIDAQI